MVVVTLPKEENKLYYSYIGDSGFVVLRIREDGKFFLVHTSASQQRRFNFPYQLGWNKNGDHPSSALQGTVDIQPEDVVVVATDGVLDNLDAHGICNLANTLLELNTFSPETLAESIAQKAFEDSLKEDFDSPFSQEARRHGYNDYLGGKSDDISVTVGKIVTKPKKESSEDSNSPSAVVA